MYVQSIHTLLALAVLKKMRKKVSGWVYIVEGQERDGIK